jgi:YggT family protein
MGIVRIIIDVYIYILIADVILSYLPQFSRQSWAVYVRKAAEFTCGPIRKRMPKDLPFDLSPLVVILILNLFVLLF